MRQTVLQLVAIRGARDRRRHGRGLSRPGGARVAAARPDPRRPAAARGSCGLARLVTSVTICWDSPCAAPAAQARASGARGCAEPRAPPLRYAAVYRFGRRRAGAASYWLGATEARHRRGGAAAAPRSSHSASRASGVEGVAPLRSGVGIAWRYGLGQHRAPAADRSSRSWPFGSGSWCCCCSRWCATTCSRTGGEPARGRPELLMINHPPRRGEAVSGVPP